ncbi:Coproporphyrinogen III oxidase, oxygen-independent [plant metagenome]|uniref:Oxygen-independent coproporphyrinogen III oxidase n=1 Tax=plant metagenome TaxID=1297885 RepID=A0A484XYQ3_9ZZZZ
MDTLASPPPSPTPAPLFSPELLRRLDKNGPRYTSYPTADRYGKEFGDMQYRQALSARAAESAAGLARPLSLYVHVPFCQSVCYYCACNKVVTRHHERAEPYLDALEREIAMHVRLMGGGAASQLHFGGGTPTFLDDDELARLMRALRTAFPLTADAEVSIEVDPRTATPARLARLAEMGFNRLSLGVQDFDADVQRAVHRIQSFESVQRLTESARTLGFQSVNMDLIYGLPKQSRESFAHTIAQVASLRPDRIALYGYAHLPQRFKPQRRILEADLPDGETRIGLLGSAIEGFLAAGYTYIGMDHFALPEDSLAIAKREGRMQRNFQGYSTHPDCDIIALGVSAIGRVGDTYSQNAKTLEEYYARLDRGRFPVVQGMVLGVDDLLRREVIMQIMCQGRIDIPAFEREHGLRFWQYFATELEALQDLSEMGLVSADEQVLQVSPQGWFFVRAVAMVFDRYLQAGRASGATYSRIV